MNLVRYLSMLIVVVLIHLVGCGKNQKEDSVKLKTTVSDKISDTLKQNKVDSLVVGTDKLMVGKKYLGDDLLKVIDKHFPGAIFSPDESIQITSGGDTYIIQTKKLNYTGPAYYEIASIQYRQTSSVSLRNEMKHFSPTLRAQANEPKQVSPKFPDRI